MVLIRLKPILACATVALIVAVPVLVRAQQRNPSDQGAQLFASNCAYCHGADGKGGRAPAIAVMRDVIAMSNQDLIAVVHNGKIAQGMPAFPGLGTQGTEAVVQYLRQLQGVSGAVVQAKPTGDADVGKQLFFGKGQCSNCHMVSGNGGFMARDLTGYAQSLTSQEVIRNIVDPDAHLAPRSEVVEVQPKKGQSLTGVLRAEDNMTLTLQTVDGRYRFFAKRDLAKVDYTGHSLMPHNYGTQLTSAELNDLAAFLIDAGEGTSGQAASPSRKHTGGQ